MSKLSQKIAAKAQARVATRRGAGFLEYALIGALVVGVAYLLRGQLADLVTGVFGADGKVNNAINGTSAYNAG